MRTATAHIALQELHDLRLTGIRIRLQQANAAHDHSGSAIRALECSRIEKRLLHWIQSPVLFKTFDGRNGLCGSRTEGNLARAARRSPNQDGACAALPFPATVLAAGQA